MLPRRRVLGAPLILATALFARPAGAEPPPGPEPPCSEEDFVCQEIALERVARDHDAELTSERRAEIDAKLSAVRKKRARVEMRGQVDGVEVRIDGECPVDTSARAIRCAPLDRPATLLVNPGPHEIFVRRDGHVAQRQAVDLGPGSALAISVAIAEQALPPPQNPYDVPMAIAWATTAAFVAGIGVTTWSLSMDPHDGVAEIRGVAVVGAALGLGVATCLTVAALRWRPPVAARLDVGPAGLRAVF